MRCTYITNKMKYGPGRQYMAQVTKRVPGYSQRSTLLIRQNDLVLKMDVHV